MTDSHQRPFTFFAKHRDAGMRTASFDFPAPDHAREPVDRDGPRRCLAA